MSAFRTSNGIISKGKDNSISPGSKRTISISLFGRNGSSDHLIVVSVPCVDAVIANHFEVFFWDMSHKAFGEF